MRKLFRVRVVLGLAALAAVFTVTAIAKASDSSAWLNANLTITKQAGAASLPAALYGNIDCFPDTSGCAVPTAYGTSKDVSVSLDGNYFPVNSYIEGRQRFVAVPDSPAFITYTANAPYGLYLYFNYNFTASVKKIDGPGPAYYQVTKPPDGKLADKSGRLLAADPGSISFSANGRWMVVSEPNAAMLRVDLQTFEVVPFAPGFSYDMGLNPAPKTAITNDGRYAVVASGISRRFEIYDINTCSAVPATIYAPVNCQSRDLNSLMRRQFADYDFVDQARFLNDDTLAVYAAAAGGPNTVSRYVISPAASYIGGIDYLALGDSYISGEGAFDYAAGTDTDANLCHLSYLSYPFLIGHDLNFDSYHSVACSGATTNDIINTSPFYVGQASRKDGVTRAVWDAGGQSALALSTYLPGYVDQLDFVKTYQPQAITISVGGNDMGFSKILTKCVEPTELDSCYSSYEDRLELVRQINTTVFNNLVKTYSRLKAAGPPEMRIYAVGYPQIAKPGGDCAVNVLLNNDEVIFSGQLIDYLDGVIAQAAARAGVYYTDTQDALNGHRLCEAQPGSVAVNGLTLGKDRPVNGLGPIGDESYHPNALGYELLENAILAATDNLTAPMPQPDPTGAPPPETGLTILDAPRAGRPVSTVRYEPGLTADLLYRQVAAGVSISGAKHALSADSLLRAQLHSDITDLGVFTTNGSGDLSADITIPAGVPGGNHTLHFYGSNINGQPIDIYKDVWVACSTDDLDCDGINDNSQACIGLPASGQDYDQDGTDDACDGEITQPRSVPSAGSGVVITADDNQILTADSSLTAAAVNPAGPAASRAPGTVLAAATQKQSTTQPKAADISSSVNPDYLMAGGVTLGLLLIAVFVWFWLV